MNEIVSLPVEVDCPEWCENHRGAKATTHKFLDDHARVEDVKYLGQHSASQLFYRRYPGLRPTAVAVQQTASSGGVWEPQIRMWHGVQGVDDEPGWPPRTSQTFTVAEARALGEALLRACQLVEEILPKRCNCGEPIEPQRDSCVGCMMAAEKAEREARRARLAAVPRGAENLP